MANTSSQHCRKMGAENEMIITNHLNYGKKLLFFSSTARFLDLVWRGLHETNNVSTGRAVEPSAGSVDDRAGCLCALAL